MLLLVSDSYLTFFQPFAIKRNTYLCFRQNWSKKGERNVMVVSACDQVLVGFTVAGTTEAVNFPGLIVVDTLVVII